MQFPLLYLRALISLPFDTEGKRSLAQASKWSVSGRGYFTQQATRPQTLGYSLSDSPVGLLAWIYEKLVDWTDQYPWTDDEGTAYVAYANYRQYSDVTTLYTGQSSSGSLSTGSRVPGLQRQRGYTTR